MFFNRYTKALVRINYKSGHSFTGWFYEFNYSPNGCTWKLVGGETQFLKIGVDDIESIYQVKFRKGWDGEAP